LSAPPFLPCLQMPSLQLAATSTLSNVPPFFVMLFLCVLGPGAANAWVTPPTEGSLVTFFSPGSVLNFPPAPFAKGVKTMAKAFLFYGILSIMRVFLSVPPPDLQLISRMMRRENSLDLQVLQFFLFPGLVVTPTMKACDGKIIFERRTQKLHPFWWRFPSRTLTLKSKNSPDHPTSVDGPCVASPHPSIPQSPGRFSRLPRSPFPFFPFPSSPPRSLTFP